MTEWALWNGISFVIAVFVNSFIEWGAHKFVMHKFNRLIPYGYEHTTSHHATFGSDKTYHALDDEMLEHGIAFTWREYVIFPVFCFCVYYPVEFMTGKSIIAGAMAAVLVMLTGFDYLHSRFHVPVDEWFQRTWFFRFLKEHHRLHHADMGCNFNVSFLPLADFCMRTLRTQKESK